jgi:CBS domain-containing protein
MLVLSDVSIPCVCAFNGTDFAALLDNLLFIAALIVNWYWSDPRRSEMKIQEVMTTNPTWCLPEDPSIQAARIMRELNVGIVPVVKSITDRKLVGVVTDRDLCLGVVAMDQHPQATPVHKCMTTNMVVCHPDEEILQAADLMEEYQVRRIPVVDQRGILQGMISTADICQRSNLSCDTTHHILKKVTEPTDYAGKPRASMPHKAA